MLLPDLIKKYPSFTLLSERDFLLRRTNSFDNNIPLIIYDINNIDNTQEKIHKLFGNAEVSKIADYIVVKARDFMDRDIYSFGDLIETIRRLRDKDGCQWDRKQTNMSIRDNTVEEAYELVEAIELNDTAKMTEECGDVILQGLFNAIIAEDSDKFSVTDTINCLCKKLVSRHTHIFGDHKAHNSQEAIHFWEKAKEQEKNQQSVTDKISAIPKTFGALMRTLKAQKIVQKTGFEFPTIADAEKKIYEELTEFKTANNSANREEEAGDLLFSVVNLLRMYGIDPEIALNATTEKFIKRFSYIEDMATQNNKKLNECTLAEMENWYQQSKQLEK